MQHSSGVKMKVLNRIVLFTMALVLLSINVIGFDIHNISRLFALIIGGMVCLSYILFNPEIIQLNNYKYLYLTACGFICWSLVSIIIAGRMNLEGFFGVYGRNTGFLTLFFLIILLVSAAISSNPKDNETFVFLIILIGTLTAIYGVFQNFGFDIVKTVQIYNPVKGLFGNPNFQSSFLGIASTCSFAIAINNKNLTLRKLQAVGFIVFSIYVIYLTDSVQGFLVFISGVLAVMYVKFRAHLKNNMANNLYLFSILLFVLALALDILQKSPWKSFLYESSVSYRGNFWRAGLKMFTENPIFGVGLDGYRDNFRFYRDLTAVNSGGSQPPINSAHNFAIDLLASGGFPLLVFTILLFLIAFKSVKRILSNAAEFDYVFAAIFGSWIAYLAQSFISVVTIPLSCVGFILTGLLIGYDRNLVGINRNRGAKKKIFIPSSLGIILASVVSLPLLINDINFKNALDSNNADMIRNSVYSYPKDVHRMNIVAEVFRRAGVPSIAIVVARDATKLNPKNYEAWEELSLMPNIEKSELDEVVNKMRALDPLNYNIR